MRRRGFLKSLAAMCALPFVPLTALSKPKIENQFFDNQDYEWRSELKGWEFHYRHGIPNSVHPGPSAGCTECTTEDYQELSDSGKIPCYEGFVRTNEGNRLWRFNKVSGLHFKCYVCDAILTLNREDFRQHGKTCNFDLTKVYS